MSRARKEDGFCPAHSYVISSLEERLNSFGESIRELTAKVDSISKTLSKLFTEQAVISSNFNNTRALSSQMRDDIDDLAKQVDCLKLKVVKLSATISLVVSIIMLALGGLFQWLQN